MSKNYYKFRNLKSKSSEELGYEFWRSFILYFKRLAKDDYFFDEFGLDDDLGYGECINYDAVEYRITEELGIEIDLSSYEKKPKTTDILSMIEFLYSYISRPDNYVQDNQGRPYPIEFNASAARYEYTIQINDMFSKFNNPYKLEKGFIKRIVSEKLDNYFSDTKTKEKKIQDMIDKSYDYFINNKKDEALTTIANALERVKTLEGNKKQSIEKMIASISEKDELKEYLNELIKLTTKISNKCTIRHFEKSKTEIENDNIKSFLYYNYFNIIKLLNTYDSN